jgi:hypothetical protein
MWAEKENWGCNAGLEANGGEHYYDGISIHPMEVIAPQPICLPPKPSSYACLTTRERGRGGDSRHLSSTYMGFHMGPRRTAFDLSISRHHVNMRLRNNFSSSSLWWHH